MNIDKKQEGSRLTIALEGELDALTAPELTEVVESSLAGITELIFDLEKMDYTSSAGLRVFLASQQIMDEQGTMTVKHVNEAVMNIFEETGFTDILDIDG